MYRPKTPRGKKLHSRFNNFLSSNNPKEISLLEVAEHLEKILSNLNNKSNIEQISKQLKDILLDIYTIININTKNNNKIENENRVNKREFEEMKKK